MKLSELTESFGTEFRYIPNKHADEMDDLVEFGHLSQEYFETEQDFRGKYPKAQKAFIFYTNPGKDYRHFQGGMEKYALKPDFSLWMDGTGKLFFADDLGEMDFSHIPDNVAQRFLEISQGAKSEAELMHLMQNDEYRSPM